ncbi:MAG: glycosyltransferase [Patescibacteria group bacterium]|jgi:glycosyltransferase involved in cell wall biosynthesis
MLSIIIPTLNEEKYLPILLNSLKKQSFSDYEIIIADACSDDATVSLAQSYGCKIVFGDKNKRHPAIQRNAGADNSIGEILLFLDADTILPDDYFLEKTLNNFRKRSLGVAGFYMDFKSRKFFYRFYYLVYNSMAFLAQYIRPVAVGAGIIIQRELHYKIGGFDEEIFIGEDQIYCEKASKIKKFRLIRKTKIFFSIRRFEKDGRWKLFSKLLYSFLYVLVLGPVKKEIIKYEFGKH